MIFIHDFQEVVKLLQLGDYQGSAIRANTKSENEEKYRKA